MEYLIPSWSRVGAVAREQRRRAGITQSDLAETAGVSRGWLIRLEAGHPNAEPTLVFRVLRALDLELVARPVQQDRDHVADEDLLHQLLGE